MVAPRRGLMLLIAASPPFNGSLALSSPSSPSHSLSTLFCRFSWQQNSIKRNNIPTQIPRLSPIVNTEKISIINPARAFHEPLVSERQLLENSDEGLKTEYASVAKNRLGWKRTPTFGFSAASPRWTKRRSQGSQQRNRLESIKNGHGTIWEVGGAGGAGRTFPRASLSSTSKATADPPPLGTDGDGQRVRARELETKHKENESQGRSVGNQDLKTSSISNSNATYGQQEGEVGRMQANRRPPPFKPRANYYDKLAPSRGNGDVVSSQATGRPPFKPKANYYDNLGKEAPPKRPFKASSNYHDRPDGDRGRSSQDNRRPPFKPKVNYYDTLGQSEQGGRNGSPAISCRDHRGDRSNWSKSPTRDGGRAHWQQDRGREPRVERSSRDSTGDEGPNYGYKFRKDGPELNQFCRIGDYTHGIASVTALTAKDYAPWIDQINKANLCIIGAIQSLVVEGLQSKRALQTLTSFKTTQHQNARL